MGLQLQGLAPLLEVFDMPTSVHFYRDLLGFELVSTSPLLGGGPDDFNWGMLRLGNVTIMLNTAYDPEDRDRPPTPDAARMTAHQDAGLWIGCPDLDGAYQLLTEKGVKVEPPNLTHYGLRVMCFSDPDGFGICLNWKP